MTCVHHWLLEPPAGPTSEATCERCDAVREFSNGEQQISMREANRVYYDGLRAAGERPAVLAEDVEREAVEAFA